MTSTKSEPVTETSTMSQPTNDDASNDVDVDATNGGAADAQPQPPAQQQPLSKNARKRLLKLEQKDQRKEHRKAEKKIRKEQRSQRAASDTWTEQGDNAEGAVAGSASVAPAGASSDLTTAAGRATKSLDEIRETIWAAWARWGAPRLVLAPMVNQSELAFRLLARKHGAGLTYTPMMHSTRFAADEAYRLENFDEHASDRPLIAQFCGDDPATLLCAARYVQGRCDAVDLNCGCPQGIARRGHYGAFLLDEPELIETLVRTLSTHLTVPCTVKIRVLPAADGSVDTAATVALALRLEAAGASLLTVHGRTRVQKCACDCDWATIRAVKQALRIPVLANGGVERPEDLEACLAATQCDGVMTSEGALENPSLLSGVPTSRLGQLQVARDYVSLSREHPPRAVAILKAHFFKILYMALDLHRDLRDRLGAGLDAETVYGVVEAVCEREEAACREKPDELSARCDREGAPYQTWYRRHRGEKEADPNRYGAFVPETERKGD
jgi:tRNA-dihydrouridine synthase 1